MLESKTLLTCDELAVWLKVSAHTVRIWARTGKIPTRKVGRSYRFDQSEVAAYFKINTKVSTNTTE